jgi:hypothetical protein
MTNYSMGKHTSWRPPGHRRTHRQLLHGHVLLGAARYAAAAEMREALAALTEAR